MPSAFGSHLFPPCSEVLWFWSRCRCCWSVPRVALGLGLSLGQSLSVWEGYIHWLVPAGAAWLGHLEWCGDTAAPCWCFCSCCLTCWMISRIFLCAVCRRKQEQVRVTCVQNVKQDADFPSEAGYGSLSRSNVRAVNVFLSHLKTRTKYRNIYFSLDTDRRIWAMLEPSENMSPRNISMALYSSSFFLLHNHNHRILIKYVKVCGCNIIKYKQFHWELILLQITIETYCSPFNST